MSGRDALANGAMNVSSGRTMLRLGLPTLADVFAAGGYRTGQFGKWHLGDVYPYRPQDRGFHEALFFPSSHIGSAADAWDNDYFDDVYEQNGVRCRFAGYCTDVFFGEAMKWMRTCQGRGEPFFAYIATNAPHGPLYVPDRYRAPYRHLPRNVASFFGMIANIDENVGKLEAMLAELGVRDDTILVFLTDNGGTAGVSVYNAGMRAQKIGLYDGGHRVPCFLRWPNGGLRGPGDVGALTTCQDLLPTLTELCGLSLPAGARFDGLSLAKLFRGEVERLPERMVVVQFSRMDVPEPKQGDAAVLWDRWRLIKEDELYDIGSDPGQKTDVARTHPEVVARMRAYYARWWSEVATRVNELSRIPVGSDAQDPTLLSACDWQDVFLDQSRQVRQGLARSGAWGLAVERAGVYEIALRRWPVEADLPIAAGAPEHRVEDGTYPAGVALPIARARLRIGAVEQARPVGALDKAVTFRVGLEAGNTQLQTWFDDAEGRELCGAYYVYLHRVGSQR
jgi:arylsulfatase